MVGRLQIIKQVLLLFIFILYNSYSQTVSGISSEIKVLMPFSFTRIGAANIGKGNAAIAEEGNPAAAFINPSALHTDSMMIYLEGGKRNHIDWIMDVELDGPLILPAYIAILKSTNLGTISAGYYQFYNISYKDFFTVVTLEHPEGTGELFEVSSKTKIHSFFCSGSYLLKESIRFGLTFSLNYLTEFDQIYNSKGEGSGLGIQLIGGVLSKPVENLNVAAVFKYTGDIKYDLKLEGPDFDLQIDTTGIYGNNPPIDASLKSNGYPFIVKFPWSLELGCSYNFLQYYTFLAKLDFQRWAHLGESYLDKTQIHSGIEIAVSPILKCSLGFFTQYHPSKYNEEYYDQKFFTIGFEHSFMRNCSLAVTFMDSHLFYNKEFLQTYIASSVSINF